MEIRGAYESELEQVIELSCVAFDPDGHERYWQYIRGDSSYRLPQTRVVVVNNRVVATLRVWERRMRVGDSLVTMGGIGGVCTHPKYRGAGYASALMRDTLDYLRLIGCDIGALFTIIPETFYQRLGWTTLPLHGFSLMCNLPAQRTSSATWQVTDFNPETDLDAVANLYDLANAQQSGTIARTRAYWDLAPSRLRSVLPSVVARQNGRIYGYLNYEVTEAQIGIREIGYLPDNPSTLDALALHLLKTCEAQQIKTIAGRFPAQHPFVEHLVANCNGTLTPTEYTGMMLHAIDLPVLLRRLVVGWEARIADAETTFAPLAVKLIPHDNTHLVLRHNPDGTLQIVHEDPNAVDLGIDLTESDFWQLLFGEVGWEQLKPDASVSPETSALLETLFPKRSVTFWVPDQF